MMISTLTNAFACLALLLATSPIPSTGSVSRPVAAEVCGPRCAQQILQHYGASEELYDLIREMQQGIATAGCSLRDIQQALESRQIHTNLVHVGRFTFPSSHLPAVIHYRSGHFVVVEDVTATHVKILDGTEMQPSWQLLPTVMSQQSGAILLTSSEGFETADIITINWPQRAAFGGALALALTGTILVRRRFLRKLPNSVTSRGVLS